MPFMPFIPSPSQPQGGVVEPWTNLRKLALTSHVLRPQNSSAPVSIISSWQPVGQRLSCPSSRLWNSGTGTGTSTADSHASFRYEKVAGKDEHGTPTQGELLWLHSWDSQWNPSWAVKLAWEGSVRAPLRATRSQIQGNSRHLRSYSVALSQLKLRDMVMDPVSRYQV
ncbi:hypothetical protein GE09DRAFT_1143779, partial [Coniochaeta sp. 2T2.1]